MQELLVPTDSLEVEVHTVQRERLRGTLFAAPLIDRDSDDELGTLLNDDRHYLPLRLVQCDGKRRETMIRKEQVTCVRLVDDGHGTFETRHEARHDGLPHPAGPRCHIFLADGESLAGTLDVDVPDSHARVIDRLNRAERFIPVTTSSGPVFINRTQVVQVV